MGLSDDEIAFGIATMGVESGFDSKAKASGSTARGLGQFLESTWKDAVKNYNSHYGGSLDTDLSRHDADSQTAVMGAYIKKVIWPTAKRHAADSKLSSYSVEEIAYGMWHEGVGTEGNVERVSKYLGRTDGYNNTNVKAYFRRTYNKAKEVLKTYPKRNSGGEQSRTNRHLDKILGRNVDTIPLARTSHIDPVTKYKIKSLSQGLTIVGKETLVRQGDKVWRIEADGSTRGYFICND